jgi:ATP-binding cassette subfamily C protein
VRRAYHIGDLYSGSARTVQSVMADSLDSIRLVRAHDSADVWRRDLAEAFDEARNVRVAYTRHSATLSAASQVGLVASAAFLVLVAVGLAVPPPTIVVVLVLIARLARSVQSLASIGQHVAHGLPGVRDIEQLTADALAAAEEGERSQPPISSALSAPVPGAPLVSLRDVRFTYPSSGGGVHDVSFDIPTGLVTALTGASGAGKSTTADLVLGLLEPDSGAILIEGHPLTHARLRAWRARVAYVPQETILIPGTLRKNLLWSVGEAPDDDACWHALDRAAAGFARELPDGLDTNLGDRGIRLSGGQRQRVAIARALLREPDLLVLDEATSSLDDVTEAAVLDLMASLGPEVTVLVIAHRRSTVEAASRVVTLADGQVV